MNPDKRLLRRPVLNGAFWASLGLMFGIPLVAGCRQDGAAPIVPPVHNSPYFGQLPANIADFPRLPTVIEVMSPHSSSLPPVVFLQEELDSRLTAVTADAHGGEEQRVVFHARATTTGGEESYYYAKTYLAESKTFTQKYIDMEIRLNQVYLQSLGLSNEEIKTRVFLIKHGKYVSVVVEDGGKLLAQQATEGFREIPRPPYEGGIVVDWNEIDFMTKEGSAASKLRDAKLQQDFDVIMREARLQLEKFNIQSRRIAGFEELVYADWGSFNNIATKQVPESMAGMPGVVRLPNSEKFVQVRWIDFEPVSFAHGRLKSAGTQFEAVSQQLTWDKYVDQGTIDLTIPKGHVERAPKIIIGKPIREIDQVVKPQDLPRVEKWKNKFFEAIRHVSKNAKGWGAAANEAFFVLAALYESVRFANPIILGDAHNLTTSESITKIFPERTPFYDSPQLHSLDRFGYEPLDRLAYKLDLGLLAQKYAAQAGSLSVPFIGQNSLGMAPETRDRFLKMALEDMPAVAVTIAGQGDSIPVPMDIQVVLNTQLKPQELKMNVYTLADSENSPPALESFRFRFDDQGRMSVMGTDEIRDRVNGGIRTMVSLFSHQNEEAVRDYLLSKGAKPQDVDTYMAPKPVIIRPTADGKDFMIYFETTQVPPIPNPTPGPIMRRQLFELFKG